MATNHLVLYATEENKNGAMVIGAEGPEDLRGFVDTELTALLGPEVKYWYTSVNMATTKAHIYDLKPPKSKAEKRIEGSDPRTP